MLSGVNGLILIAALFLWSVRQLDGANVLVVQPDIVFPSSHFFIFNGLIEELADRGHRLFVRLHLEGLP